MIDGCSGAHIGGQRKPLRLGSSSHLVYECQLKGQEHEAWQVEIVDVHEVAGGRLISVVHGKDGVSSRWRLGPSCTSIEPYDEKGTADAWKAAEEARFRQNAAEANLTDERLEFEEQMFRGLLSAPTVSDISAHEIARTSVFLPIECYPNTSQSTVGSTSLWIEHPLYTGGAVSSATFGFQDSRRGHQQLGVRGTGGPSEFQDLTMKVIAMVNGGGADLRSAWAMVGLLTKTEVREIEAARVDAWPTRIVQRVQTSGIAGKSAWSTTTCTLLR